MSSVQQLRMKAQSGQSHGTRFQNRRLHKGRDIQQHYKHMTIKNIRNSRMQEIRSTISQQPSNSWKWRRRVHPPAASNFCCSV